MCNAIHPIIAPQIVNSQGNVDSGKVGEAHAMQNIVSF